MRDASIDDLCTCINKLTDAHGLECAIYDVPAPARKEIIRLRVRVEQLKKERDEWKKKHDEVNAAYGHSLWEKR